MSQPIKIVLFASGSNALDTLKALVDFSKRDPSYEIVGIVTQPDKPAGRGKQLKPTAVKQFVHNDETMKQLINNQIFQPAKLRDEAERIVASSKPDLIIVIDYGQIVPNKMLDYPRYRSLNIHFSLLPKYRGARPYQAAILNGDRETGITIQAMAAKLDEGDIIAQEKIAIEPRETTATLLPKLSKLGAETLIKVLPDWIAGKITPRPQDHTQATYTYIADVSKDKARIQWSQPAEVIDRQIRAFYPNPLAWTTWSGKRLLVLQAQPLEAGKMEPPLHPGQTSLLDNELIVGTGSGPLQLEILQLEGKKPLPADELLHGYPQLESTQFEQN
jgi:methionyl-tRNA formyltransferase